jgi:transcriptional regulator with XRE-family HTH domain
MSIDVGNRLRTIRQLHGLSQRELARRAGVTNGLISLVEMNRVSPSVGSLKKLLDGIPMSLAEFFTGDFNQRTPVFYGADELVEIGNEEVSLKLVAAQRAGRQMTLAGDMGYMANGKEIVAVDRAKHAEGTRERHRIDLLISKTNAATCGPIS